MMMMMMMVRMMMMMMMVPFGLVSDEESAKDLRAASSFHLSKDQLCLSVEG